MGEKGDSRFRDPIQGKWNRNSIRYSGNYGTDTFLSSSFNDNDLGRSMPLVGALYNEDGFRGGDELPRQVKLPCQNASHLDRQNHYDGNEPVKPPINGEFDDFGGRRGREDYTNHVRSIDSQWENDECDRSKQLVDSDGESKKNTGNRMVLPTCSERIRGLSSQLGPLLRVHTLEGNARTKKQPCHLVLPDNRPKIWKNENDSSVCQVSTSDEFDGIYGYRSNSPIVIDTIMKSNRCHIANSTGFKLYDEDQEDYISYIKEELTGYIEEVKMYGFDHIIIIGELNYGLLFLDCFGRMFNLDSITSHLLLLGDYFKRVERVTKGLYTELASWIVDSDEGKIVEINGPEHYLIPFRKKQIEKEHMKKKKKKGSRKKHR